MKRRMKLTSSQLKKLSDICADIAQIALGSVAIPFLLNEFQPVLALCGILLSLAFWYASLVLMK